jgi:hypothetical protein
MTWTCSCGNVNSGAFCPRCGGMQQAANNPRATNRLKHTILVGIVVFFVVGSVISLLSTRHEPSSPPQAVSSLPTPVVTEQQEHLGNEQNACLSYGTSTILPFSGTIAPQTFPGPPNYEGVEKGDASETVWILTLDTPICTLQAEQDQPAENNVGTMQLLITGTEMYNRYQPQLGRSVIVTGSLEHAITGHNHTSVMLAVLTISPNRSNEEPPKPILPPAPKGYTLGQSVSIGYWSYRCDNAEWTGMLGNGFTAERANAAFLLLDLTVQNNDKSASILPPFHLVDTEGRTYDESSAGAFAEGFFSPLEKLNPSVSKRGHVVFDVPRDREYRLQVSGGFNSSASELITLFPPDKKPN